MDLISGYLGGRIGGARFLPVGNITYMRDHRHETTLVGTPDERVGPSDGGPKGSGHGVRFSLGIRLTF